MITASTNIFVILIIICVSFKNALGDSQTRTQCSEIIKFEYLNFHQKNFSAIITLRSQTIKRSPTIEIEFDREITLLTNYLGHTTTTNNRNFRITNNNVILYPHERVNFKIEIDYDTQIRPSINEIKMNGDVLCTNSKPQLYPSTSSPSSSSSSLLSVSSPSKFTHTSNTNHNFTSTCQALEIISVNSGRLDAVVNLNTEVTVYGITVEIIFRNPVYSIGNEFGRVTKFNNVKFKIENSTLILLANSNLDLDFYVKFNEYGDVPDVENILFNNKDICKNQRIRRDQATTAAPDIVFRDHSTNRSPSSLYSYKTETTTNSNYCDDCEDIRDNYDSSICASIPRNLVSLRIIGGKFVKQGEFPWHAAIFVDNTFSCGGSLISRRTILTVAHCLVASNTVQTLSTQNMRIYLGLLNLNDSNLRFHYSVSRIIIHKDFNPIKYTTDIGLVILTNNVAINEQIKPVCLYNRTRDITTLYDRDGSVAGWGINRNDEINHRLKYLKMPVVSQKVCMQSNRYYSNILAFGESFCAGNNDAATSVCNGDSGGGLVFENDEDSKYYIRGIISVSAQKQNQLTCDPEIYTVFTDVSKFLKWIRKNLL
uniref:Putative transmembrane protease n=1 Tax=Corethrella appendiculata TaxID=1370023 RepID=U5ESS6_9DIPT